MRKIALTLIASLSLAVAAQEQSVLPEELSTLMESTAPDAKVYREEVKENLNKKGKVIGIKELPMDKLYFVEAEGGSYVVSANGRFVFDGRLVDVWHRKTIRTLKDAEKIQRTPVSNIGFEPEKQLATFQFGDPDLPRSGLAFVDPTSEFTLRFLNHIEENKDKYNFTVVLMPLVGGANAFDRARRLWCAKDRDGAKQDFLNGTSDSLSAMKNDCPEDPLQMANFMVNILNIEDLPHIIREDGLVSEGFPIEFDKWFIQP